MNESLKSIVASLVPHIQDALETYAANFENPVKEVRIRERAYITGYLIAARNSGILLEAHCDRLLDEIRSTDGYRIIAACFEPVLPPVTEGERSLYRYKFEAVGGFEYSLWETIFKADSHNLSALRSAYPEHVQAYQNYGNQRGWWDALVQRIKAGE